MMKFNKGGPGVIIAAAFIGPGTVTICTLAGAGYGLQLLWAVFLSTILTIFFQEMASRLGIVSQQDLTSLIKQEIKQPVARFLTLFIILSAIVLGNAAYEAGNISGGALGIHTFLDLKYGSFDFTPILIGSIAFAILWFGNQKILTTALTILVLFMSASFIWSAVMVQPDFYTLLNGLFFPKVPTGSLILVLGVVGTTVVPYNLFLHASLAKTQWKSPMDLKNARRDTIIAVSIGGLVSMAIVVSASALQNQNIQNAVDMAQGLKPVFGSSAHYLISTGLFAAGITSAITAPLAAAFVMTGVFGWSSNNQSRNFRLTWITILVLGVVFSSVGFRPIAIIKFAQVTNGLILPVIAVILVWLCSKTSLLGDYKNKPFATLIGIGMIVLLTVLGVKSVWLVFFMIHI